MGICQKYALLSTIANYAFYAWRVMNYFYAMYRAVVIYDFEKIFLIVGGIGYS